MGCRLNKGATAVTRLGGKSWNLSEISVNPLIRAIKILQILMYCTLLNVNASVLQKQPKLNRKVID